MGGGFGRNIGLLTEETTDDLTRTHDAALGGRKEKTASKFLLSTQYTYPITSELDLLGRPKERIYPDGEKLQFTYAASTNTEVTLQRASGGSVPLFSGIKVHPSGGLENITHGPSGTGILETRLYNSAYRLSNMDIGPSGSIQKLAFEYDPAGNLLRTRSGSPLTTEQDFWYDGTHRLAKSADYRTPTGYGTIDYAYDNAGNMTRKGMNAFRYGGIVDFTTGRRALPDAVTTVLFNAYDASVGNTPTLSDPCPNYSGEGPGLIQSTDQNLDGIPNICQCGDATYDGNVTVSDQVLVNNCPFNPPSCILPLCDATNDNACNVSDVVKINGTVTTGRWFENKCSVRPEAMPVWDANYTYKYDADGRATERNWGAGNVKTFNWDNEGRMSSTAGISYKYDAAGQRVMKDLGSTKQLFVSAEFEVEITSVSGATGTHQKHIFVMGQRSLTIKQNNIGNAPNPAPPALIEEQLRLFGDQLGSQRFVTDSAGTIQQRTVMTPYGETQSTVNASGTPIPTVTPFLFTGHHQDPEAALHYMGARYYDPLIGRFLSTDPELIGPKAGMTFGRIGSGAVNASAYAYAMNRPTGFVDPTGRASEAFSTSWGGYTYVNYTQSELNGAVASASFMGTSSATVGGVTFEFGSGAGEGGSPKADAGGAGSAEAGSGPPVELGSSLKGDPVAKRMQKNAQGVVDGEDYVGQTRNITIHKDNKRLRELGEMRGESARAATDPAHANSDGTYDVNIYVQGSRFGWWGRNFTSQGVTNSLVAGELYHALYHPTGFDRFDVGAMRAGEFAAHTFELNVGWFTGLDHAGIAGWIHRGRVELMNTRNSK